MADRNPDPNNNNSRARTANANNNNARATGPSPGRNALLEGLKELPPIATSFALFQILLFYFSDQLIASEEDIHVSWTKVFTHREIWRLFIAHFFHFGQFNLLFNVISLLAMGRYLERKINKGAMILLIEAMGVISNLLYILISKYICGNPGEMSTSGFAHLGYGLRIVLAYIQEGLVTETVIVFGVYPMNLSATWAPWQPLVELLFLKLIISQYPCAGPSAGISSGFLLAFVIHLMRRTPPPPPTAPPAAAVVRRQASRLNTSHWTNQRP